MSREHFPPERVLGAGLGAAGRGAIARATVLSWLCRERSLRLSRAVREARSASNAARAFINFLVSRPLNSPHQNGGACCLLAPGLCAVWYFCPWPKVLGKIVICVLGFDLSQKCPVLSLPALRCGKRQPDGWMSAVAALSLPQNIRAPRERPAEILVLPKISLQTPPPVAVVSTAGRF